MLIGHVCLTQILTKKYRLVPVYVYRLHYRASQCNIEMHVLILTVRIFSSNILALLKECAKF